MDGTRISDRSCVHHKVRCMELWYPALGNVYSWYKLMMVSISFKLFFVGCNPYPGVSPDQLFSLLQNGYRMRKPPGCSQTM